MSAIIKDKPKTVLTHAAALFVAETRHPDTLAARVTQETPYTVSGRTLQRYRKQYLEFWQTLLDSQHWDRKTYGDHFSIGQKPCGRDIAFRKLDAMPAGLSARHLVRRLRLEMPGFNRSSYPKWVKLYNEKTHRN